jgi:hypothetical protein
VRGPRWRRAKAIRRRRPVARLLNEQPGIDATKVFRIIPPIQGNVRAEASGHRGALWALLYVISLITISLALQAGSVSCGKNSCPGVT